MATCARCHRRATFAALKVGRPVPLTVVCTCAIDLRAWQAPR